jgi:hypothetical protein
LKRPAGRSNEQHRVCCRFRVKGEELTSSISSPLL